MFESLKEAFRQAGENFRTELNRDRTAEAVDRLLLTLRDELADLTRESGQLQPKLERVEAAAAEEGEAAETCLRRGRMADQIGDAETAAVAREFAEKHRRRRELLLGKASALSKELAERKATIAEMTDMYTAARGRRESLLAAVGRARSRERMRQAHDLFEEMDRIARRIEELEASSAGSRELKDVGPGSIDEATRGRGDPAGTEEADARLETLKRKVNEK